MIPYINLDYEKKLLRQEFESVYELVKDNDFLNLFASEKIKHSLQVLGAGNYIIKHEDIFQNKDAEFIKIAKQACLLHDIGRFREIKFLYADINSKHDHSIYSYERLKELGFSDLRLLLPVKQHGHLREALDNDEEFKSIKDKALQTEIREIYQLVKDADKIANFHIIKVDNRIFEDLFALKLKDDDIKAGISSKVWQSFEKRDLVISGDRKTFLDRLMQVICLVFELYYKPSYQFLIDHQLIEHIWVIMRQYNPDKANQKYIEDEVNKYIIAHLRGQK